MLTLTKNWWVLVLRGVLAIIFAVLTFVRPGITLASLVLLFGAFAFADGVLHLIAAFRSGTGSWWALVLAGLFGIGAGVVTFFYPGLTALTLLYCIAFWSIFAGVAEIMAAIRLRKEIEGEWLLGLAGLIVGNLRLSPGGLPGRRGTGTADGYRRLCLRCRHRPDLPGIQAAFLGKSAVPDCHSVSPALLQQRLAHQAVIDGLRGVASLADRPDDQRLPASRIAGGENPGLIHRLVVLGLDVAAGSSSTPSCSTRPDLTGPVKPMASSTRSASSVNSVPASGSNFGGAPTRMA